MAPPSDGVEWNDGGIEGTKRFLNKLWENIERLSKLEIVDLETMFLPGTPRIAGFNYWGTARTN